LRLVAQGFAGIQAATGEADALLAVCAEAAGNTVERDRALARTRTLRVGIKARQEVYFVDIALAKVDGTRARGRRRTSARAGPRRSLRDSKRARLFAQLAGGTLRTVNSPTAPTQV